MDRIPLADKEGHDLVERQADDVAVGSHELHHERAGEALNGVAAGLATPFAGGEIALRVLARQALEAHPRLDQALADVALGGDECEAGIDAVRAGGEKAEAG